MLAREWLEHAENWGLWYEDKHICAAYYKYDFDDGSRLIAVVYGYNGSRKTCAGGFRYHMIFSDAYREKHAESGNDADYPSYYTDRVIDIDMLVGFVRKLQKEAHMNAVAEMDDSVYVSNDFVMCDFNATCLDDDNKKKMYITRQYSKFYQIHGYIPMFFNAKNAKEITDYAVTLTTSCGSATGAGAVIVFDAVKEIKMIDIKLLRGEITWEEAKKLICKIWQVADPEVRERIKKMWSGQQVLLE